MAITCPPNCISGTPLWELYDVTDENPEFCLYESIMQEYVDIAGFPVLYYRAKSKLDRLYGEDANQDYYEPVRTKLYYEPTDEPNIIDMFGIRSDETLEYTLIPKSTFTRDVGGVVTGVPYTIENAVGGSNYYADVSVETTGGTGTGLRVYTEVSGGVINKITIDQYSRGSGYTVGDVITITGGDDNATFEIASVDSVDIQPIAGDVIKTLWNNRNYEIVDTGAESNIFMAKKLIWEFILRPFRFSEQSLKSEEIHRSSPAWTYIYIYPDGILADVMYPDGTEATGVAVDTLDIDLSVLECGYKYKRNEDGSIDVVDETMVQEEELFPHPTYSDTGIELETKPATTWGDNSWIEVESDKIDNYGDIDDLLFVNPTVIPISYGSYTDVTLTQSAVDSFTNFSAQVGQTYSLQLTIEDDYLYIVVPTQYGAVSFTVNGLTVNFEETTANFLMGGSSYTCRVYKSEFELNDNVTFVMISQG